MAGSAIVVVDEVESVVISVEGATSIVISPEVRQAVVVSSPGIPGPRGEQGPAGNIPSAVAGVTLSGHRAIAIDALGKAVYADCLDTTALALAGISTGAATQGDTVFLQYADQIEWPSADLTSDQIVFLSENGLLTQTAPTIGWSRQVGFAIAADRLLINIGPAYWLGHLNP
jgi:hypothetical protein